MEIPETLSIHNGREVETEGKVFTKEARELLEVREDNSKVNPIIREKDGIFFRTPGTINKELGHTVHLNPQAPAVPGSSDGGIHSSVPTPAKYLPILIPDRDGIFWTHQTDGLVMTYPSLRGHLLFHDTQPITDVAARLKRKEMGVDGYNDLLATVNYGQGNLGPYEEGDIVDLWSHIDDDILLFETTDVAAPDGYPQTQEGIRWVRNDGPVDRAYRHGGTIMSGFSWIKETQGEKLAICYRNCD